VLHSLNAAISSHRGSPALRARCPVRSRGAALCTDVGERLAFAQVRPRSGNHQVTRRAPGANQGRAGRGDSEPRRTVLEVQSATGVGDGSLPRSAQRLHVHHIPRILVRRDMESAHQGAWDQCERGRTRVTRPRRCQRRPDRHVLHRGQRIPFLASPPAHVLLGSVTPAAGLRSLCQDVGP
jgi:hypothetical protein